MGYFMDRTGASECLPCPPNSVSLVLNATTARDCVCSPGYVWALDGTCGPCPAGQYCPTPRPQDSVPCPLGTYQTGTATSSASSCSSCVPGTYIAVGPGVTRADLCVSCSAGAFQSGWGQTSSQACSACLAGTYGSSPGLSECTPCHAGTVQTGRGMQISSRCMACTAGTYQTGVGVASISSCTRCAGGTYQTGFGMSSFSQCAPCQAGTFQPILGQTFAAACLSCQQGTYQTGTGITSGSKCVRCSPGTFQSGVGASRKENCTLCQPGTFLAESGGTDPQDCTRCPTGTYQTGLGAVHIANCSLCSAGTFEPGMGASQPTCTLCRAGTYQTGLGLSSAGVCVECGPGSYQTGLGVSSSDQCVKCGPGTFLAESGATRLGSCQLCGAGTYQTGAGASTALNCTLCEPGGYQTGVGRGYRSACIPCSAGTYQSASGATTGQNCILCGEGTYQPLLSGSGMLSCIQCARGSYQSGVGMALASDCLKCAVGFVQTSLGGTGPGWCTLCGAGTYGSMEGAGWPDNCTRCDQGNYQTGLGATSRLACVHCDQGKVQPTKSSRSSPADCVACGPGTYAPGPDASACQPCMPGTFQTGSMQSNCSLCRQGTYQPFAGVHYESWCAPCDRGTYQPGFGVSSPAGCIRCSQGAFASETGGVSACMSCGTGKYTSFQGGQLCLSCLSGLYASQVAAGTCDSCSAGTYGNTSGQSACLSCGLGQYQRSNGSSACLLCPPGRFQTALGGCECNPCSAGTFQNETGQTYCALCRPGFFQPGQDGTACLPCTPGQFQTGSGGLVCSQCKQGTYHQRTARTSGGDCANCSAGFFGAGSGVSYCASCETGTYSDETGQTACLSCEAGYFQNVSNGTGCHSCSSGSFSTVRGMGVSQCIGCSPGYYANASGSTACGACDPGTFQTGLGASLCVDCRAGEFMAFVAWHDDPCTPCAPGTFSTQLGAATGAACGLCEDGLFSFQPGQNSNQSCKTCPLGTVSISNKSECAACPRGTYCPPGYHVPIQCFPGLVCSDGASVLAPPGYLPIIHGNCTGMIPCPPGTNCTISGMDKGVLGQYPNRTHFIVFVGGDNQTDLSCPGATLSYGYDRVDWPYDVALYEPPMDILFWMEPLGCPAGAYLLDSACVPCPRGMHSTSTAAITLDACQPCPVGMYGSAFGATACTLCPAGTGQADAGSTACMACSSAQFSSSGDVLCSSCVSGGLLDPGHECPTPGLPQNSSAIWLSVRGGFDTDDCIGMNRSSLSDNRSLLSMPVTMLNPQGQCDHTLNVMGRPDLSRTWGVQRAILRRPVTLRVVPHNETFYPSLCARQGFGVLFTVEDEFGEMHTDLSAVKATIAILDFTGQTRLFSMGCTRLPSSTTDPVPVGACYTSYCPTTRVMVRVTISWNGGSVRGYTLVAPGPSVWCGATSSWIAAVELVTPSVPYFPGDSIRLYIRVLNSPAQLAVFRFALRMLPGVGFVSFRSAYSAISRVDRDIVSVVGDSSQGGGTVLGVLTLQIQDDVAAGVIMVVQVVPDTFQFTLPNTVAYSMFVRTYGFSCRSDGYLQALVDTLRVTSIIAKARRGTLIHWKRIQGGSGLSVSTRIDTIGVRNTMRSYGLVASQCTSLHPSDLVVLSCGVVQAAGSGHGNPAASIRVQYQAVSTLVNIMVYIPQNWSVWTARSVSGRSGRYKVFTHLQAGGGVIRDVDATPYVSSGIQFSGSISVQSEQWTCNPAPSAGFTVGNPVLFAGLCTDDSSPLVDLEPTLFLFTGGSPGLGQFVLSRSELSAEASTGGLLLLSSARQGGLPLSFTSMVTTGTDRVSFASKGVGSPWMSLVRSGASARCAPVVFSGVSGTRMVFTGGIPVFPPVPVELRLSLSATTLVSTNEVFTGLLPLSTSVVQAVLVLSDTSTLDVRTDVRFRMTSPDELLNISGLGCVSGAGAGNATLVFSVDGMPCVTTSIVVRVVAFSVQTSGLSCPLCPETLTTVADPLSMQFPAVYQSSVPQSWFTVRRLLTDGTILRRFEPISVSGDGTLIDGMLVGLRAGYAVVTTNFTSEPYLIPILNRWAVSWKLVCNQYYDCSSDLKLAPPGDGAGLPPFAYTTRLTLSLSLTLVNGGVANFSWLAGAAVTANQTELVGIGGKEVPLRLGGLAIRAFFDERWQLPESVYSVVFRVEQLAAILISGPAMLYQMHCSQMWEEGVYAASGVLTDGTTRVVQAQYTTTGPLAFHDNRLGLAHADWAGTGRITATFGTRAGSVWVQATPSSKYFTSIGLDFIPSQWSAPLAQPLESQPMLEPVFWGSQWFALSNLTSRVLQWTSSAPEVIGITPVDLRLLSDYYEPVTVTARLVACDTAPATSSSKDVVVNVVPDTPGQMDYGYEAGIPVPQVARGQSMAIPIYIYAPARLRSYTVEVYLQATEFESMDCTAGQLPASQCASMPVGAGIVFRAVGAMLHSAMTGRLLVATIMGIPTQDSIVAIRVRLLQAVVGEQIVLGSEYAFLVRMGVGPLAIGYRYNPGIADPFTTSSIAYQAYGDADGDGFFTNLDVLFMEHYASVSVFGGEQQICIVQGRCQLTSQLTEWQLMQLKPVRNPNMPATLPDGSDLLFMLRALVGKAFFLTSLEIRSHPGSLSLSLSVMDHMQRLNPPNAVVQVHLITNGNRALAFDTPFEYDAGTSVLAVDCKRVGTDFAISSLPTAVTVDESLVGLRVVTQALDLYGSQESASSQDRRFVFLPVAPVASFNVLASVDSLLQETPWLDYLATTSCQNLCDDSSMFIDNTLGPPVWLDETTVTAPFTMYPPVFQGFWPFASEEGPSISYDMSIPANIPAPGAVLVGSRFNMTFQAPAGITMGLFRVDGAALIRAYDGADALGNVFFMHTARSPVAHLELILTQPGVDLPVRVVMLHSFPFEAAEPNALAHTAYVTGFVPAITSLRVEVLCRSGVILWSALGGVDEPCELLLTPLWTPAAVTSSGMRATCLSYPCILQGFSQTVRPVIQTYVPTKPRIVVQKGLISLGQRIQWRAVCDLVQGAVNVTVTQRALGAGVIKSSPANALVITQDSIRGGKLGRAVVRFGNNRYNSSVGINVTDAIDLPNSLKGFAFSGIDVNVSVNRTITAVFRTGALQAGQRGFIVVHAIYSGGYSILLNPKPSSSGLSVVNASRDVIQSQLDGSFLIRPGAEGGPNRAIVTVLYRGLALTIRADVTALPVNNRSAGAQTVFPQNGSGIANITTGVQALIVTTTPDVEIVQSGPGVLLLNLIGVGITAFYIQLQIDGPVSLLGCAPESGLPLFSDCEVNPPFYPPGGVILTGASVTPMRNGTALAVILFNATSGGRGTFTGIWGFLEVHTGLSAVRFPVVTGRRGDTWPDNAVNSLMPALPTEDSTSLHRRYSELFLPVVGVIPQDQSPLYRAIFTLFLLTCKQRNVDARLYSNEFELSAMFRVMDRFLEPDTNQTKTLTVIFHTDQLPALPGSTLVAGLGLKVQAAHVLDGWYVVEWRQQIPVISGLRVSFSLETSTLHYAWPWEVSDSLLTGSRLPSCPRAATDIGTFLMSYEIAFPGDISQALLDQIACSVQVPGRRVLLGPAEPNGMRTLSIGLESLTRVYQANLVVMSDWFLEQLASISEQTVVQRGRLRYINDTRDPPIPCPLGFYFTKNGTYQHLPMHAVAGSDCYDLNCVQGYTLAPETQQCIPVPESVDMVWVCVLVVLTLILAVSAVVFCVQLSMWRLPVDEVVFTPPIVEPDGTGGDALNCQPSYCITDADDDFDLNIQFQNIVTGVVLDDYSVMMLDDDFSPVPLD